MTREHRAIARGALALAFTLLSLAYAAFLHHGLGPAPDPLEASWWSPRGFLGEGLAGTALGPAVSDARIGVWLFALPAVLLAVAVFATTSSALARALAVSGVAACLLFAFYGIASTPRLIWGFFHWRGSATMAVIALAIGCAATAPWLASSWLRRGPGLRIALYLPVFVSLVALLRNTTGTDPALPFEVSPWPAISVFGLEVAAAAFAAQFAGIALALAGLAAGRRRRGAGGLAWAALGIAVGITLPTASLAIGASAGLLPFRVDGGRLLFAALLCAVGTAAVAGVRSGLRPEVLASRAWALGVGAALVGAPLLLGQLWARLDYGRTREARAAPLIEALGAYYERETLYPESLDELVEAGDLDSIPEPRIGFAWLGESPFVYQSFGVGYVLEFSAPRWVQCAYSPPWEEEDELDGALASPGDPEPDVAAAHEAEPDEGDDPAGVDEEGWTCPSKPPELW